MIPQKTEPRDTWPQAHDLVTVAKFATTIEAEMARARLEQSGIRAFLGNAVATGVMPFLGNDLGGVTLQVSAANEAEARDVLSPVVQG